MPEGLESVGSEGEEGLEDTIESEEGLFIEGDGGEVVGLKSGEIESTGGGSGREGFVPFDAGEPLFLRCRDDFGASNQAGGTVVIKGRQA